MNQVGVIYIFYLFINCLFYVLGTLILLRGHILPHEVEAWEGGQRVCVAHFTHQSLWDQFGMKCP